MPAGVSWPTYLKFAFAAGASMIAGAQTVHLVYRPLEDLDSFIEKFEEEAVKAVKNQEEAKPKEEVKKAEEDSKQSESEKEVK